MTRIVDAVQLGRSGQKVRARDILTALWDEIGAAGDAFHRCTLAHYLADLQETTEAELSWDERALAAVSQVTDERAQQYHYSLQVQGFLPSLHLNLAHDHRRLGNTALAREHLAMARRFVGQLPDNAYGKGIRLVVDTVTRINASERSVTLATGGPVGYDYLIYAVGSGSADPRVPGAAEFAYPIASLEEAQRLRPVLDAAPATAAVTVVGAGPTGIETATELAELGRTVTLVCGEVLGPYLHPRGRRSVAKQLAKLGVTVLEGPDAKVMAVSRDAVQLADGRTLPSTVTIWTAGFGVPDLAARSGLSTDALGRLLTDETLTSVDDVRVVAAGDSAAPSDLPFRMSCQAAGPLGAHAADTVLSQIAGEQPAPLALAFVGQCISLGRRAGIFQFAHRNDTAMRLHLGGLPGAKLKEFVCWGTVKQLAIEARKPGLFSLPVWATDDKRRQLLQARRGEAPATAERAA